METPTLAEKLGTTTHLSPLLRKARRLGLGAEELERLAIQRGCDYYHNGEPLPPASVSQSEFSNEQLAIALLNPALRYEPENPFWKELLASLPTTSAPKSGVLPHPTRFIAMTGFTRRGAETVTEWIRPEGASLVHG